MADVFEGLPKGVQAELHRRILRSRGVRFQNSMFEGTSESSHGLRTVRVIRSGKMAIAAGTKPGAEAMLLKDALELSKYGTSVDYCFPGPAELSEIELASPQVSKIDFREMIDIGDDLLHSLLKIDKNIKAFVSAGAQETEVALENTNGFSGKYSKTVFQASLGAQYIQGDDFLRLGEFRSSWANDIDYRELKKEVAQLFEWAKETTDIEPGAYPVIFAPGEIDNLARPFIASLNGKSVARGISPLEEKLGEQILDPRVTLIDDGTLPREISSVPFDREGVPTQRNILIDKGVPRQVLTDLETARQIGLSPTGNGSGSGPQPHRVILVPGEASIDELISGIDLGLIVFGTMGAWTGNPFGGNVSGTISLGLKICKGKIVGRVKNCMFSLNSFDHFRDCLIGLSKDTKAVGDATYPYVALNDVVITTG